MTLDQCNFLDRQRVKENDTDYCKEGDIHFGAIFTLLLNSLLIRIKRCGGLCLKM